MLLRRLWDKTFNQHIRTNIKKKKKNNKLNERVII